MDKNGTILIVDDSPVVLSLLSDVLITAGYEVSRAENGEQALASVAAKKPDLILLDILMPGMDGFEVCSRLKAQEETSAIPVIFLATEDSVKDKVHGFTVGAVDFVSKPFQSKELLARAGIHLKISRINEELRHKTNELNMSQRLLNEAGKLAKIGGWELDAETDVLTWTEEVCRIHEVDVTCQPTVGDAIHFYAPASRPVIERAVQRAFDFSEPFDLELEIITAKGNHKWVHAIGDLHQEPGKNRKIFGVFQDITERRHIEMALRSAHDRLRGFIDANIVGVVVADPAGGIIEANDYYLNMIGYSREEFEQGMVNWRAITPPEWLAVDEQALTELREVGISMAYEKEYLRRDGTRVSVFLSDALLPGSEGHIVAFVLDVTERKKSGEKLAASEAEFRRLSLEFHGLLDAIPDSLMLVDRDMKLLWANKASIEGLGLSSDTIEEQCCYTLCHKRATPCDPCPAMQSFSTGMACNETVTRPDGSIWDIRTVPLTDEQGTVANVIELSRDITEHRKLEEQLRQSQKMESIGTLAGGVAHNFNNILTAIIGYGQFALMKMQADDPLRHNIDCMLEGADRAARLTRELLLFSRKQVIDRRAVDLNQVVTKVEKFLTKVIGEDIALQTILDESPIQIFADDHHIEQVLMNLATNSRDAMLQGGVLTVTTGIVKLNTDFVASHGYVKMGTYALLTIADTGTGMDEATTKRIFEPFFTTKEVGKGTGLGLAITYGIIKQHDGYITVYSEPGRGTSFKIYLPLIVSELGKDLSQAQDEAPVGGTETILLAEDDEAVRVLTKSVLTEFGYTVIEALDGVEAVSRFREKSDEIDLLVLDLIMPKMNGKEALDEIREMSPGIKVIFSSGYAPETIRQKVSLGKGAVLITKPVSPTELLSKVRKVLDEKQ